MRYLILVLELAFVLAYFFLRDESLFSSVVDAHPRLHVLLRFLVFVALVDVLRRGLRLWYERRFNARRQEKNNFDYGVNNVATVVVFTGAIIYFFQLFGIDVKTLLTSVSIVAAAIAIITKEYINDFLVGLYFSFSRNFEIHDYVKIGEYKGKITELQMLKLRMLNDDDDNVLIPNSKVYQSEIINYTRRDIRAMSIDFEMSINFVGTMEQLESELAAALQDYAEFIEPDTFNLRLVEMKKDSVELKFQYRLKKFDRELQRDIRKKTVRAVFNHIAGKIVKPGPLPLASPVTPA